MSCDPLTPGPQDRPPPERPAARSIAPWLYNGDWRTIAPAIHIGPSPFIVVEIGDGDIIYVDGEALLKPLDWFFAIKGCHQPFAGCGLAGATIDEHLSPEKVLQAAHRNEDLGTLLPDQLQQHESGSPLFQLVLEGAPAEPGVRSSADDASGEPGPRRNPVDAIASAISLGISMLEGLTTPSSPLDRARAKVRAVRHEEEMAILSAELHQQKIKDDFTRCALAAVREAERERKLDHEERDRGRSRYLER